MIQTENIKLLLNVKLHLNIRIKYLRKDLLDEHFRSFATSGFLAKSYAVLFSLFFIVVLAPIKM